MPKLRVREQEKTTLKDCEDAYERFKVLKDTHHGRTRRAQPCPEVSEVLNQEGFGIETPALEALRL